MTVILTVKELLNPEPTQWLESPLKNTKALPGNNLKRALIIEKMPNCNSSHDPQVVVAVFTHFSIFITTIHDFHGHSKDK